ncbi:MAG: dTMP kinase [Elusimicrobia bacterium]|nr:dTMP kinase [Elusimicrobiota bacterium]MBD3412653.1 dTMP kinase [Elusimicrobiota bacterium]
MPRAQKGQLITFEGIDGSGKTTQIQLLKKFLLKKKQKVFVTREPGGAGCPFAEAVRSLVLNPEYQVHPRSELLLYEASRAQHVEVTIKPFLLKGYWVLCDRFTDATLAYQGGGRNIPGKYLAWLNRFATGNMIPDLTILLDVNVQHGLRQARMISARDTEYAAGAEGDRLEQEDIDFHQRVRRYYLKLAHQHRRIKRIPVSATVEATHRMIVQTVLKKWPRLGKI